MSTRWARLFVVWVLLAISTTFGAAIQPARAGSLEGGYVYNHGEDRFVDNVYNFLKHFNYDQYYWAQAYEFTNSNNWYSDSMDLAYYSGHGNHWYMGMGPGASSPQSVDISTANTWSNGWGDSNMEFICCFASKVDPGFALNFDPSC